MDVHSVSQDSRRSRALTSSSIIVCCWTPVFLSPIFINLSVALKGNCLPSPPPNPYDLRPPTRWEVERGVSSRREARCQDGGGVGAWWLKWAFGHSSYSRLIGARPRERESEKERERVCVCVCALGWGAISVLGQEAKEKGMVSILQEDVYLASAPLTLSFKVR